MLIILKKIVYPVLKSGLHVVGKLRKDANLMWLYKGDYSGKGRLKKYTGKVDTCDLNSFIYKVKIENQDIYTQVVYSKCLQRNIKIVLLLITKGKK
jgi:hypothetical protein